jgi:hypothetical protein
MDSRLQLNGRAKHITTTPNFAEVLKSAEFNPIAKLRPTPRPADSLDWFLASHLFTRHMPTERNTDIAVNRINTVEPEQLSWLWMPYIALGKLTLLEGDPGIGKSFITCALATAVSTGHGLPDGSRASSPTSGSPSAHIGAEAPANMTPTKPSNVIMFTAEDGLGDTIRPRLERMKADLDRIYAVSQLISFDDKGLGQFEEVVAVYEPHLVIIDPLTVYMANTDIHRSNCVQEVMSRLAAIATKFQCAILCVRHISKARGSRAINAGLGSIAFSGAVRSILLAGADPDDESKRAVVHTKSNLAVKGESQGYAITNEGFRWTGVSTLTAERILLAAPDVEGHAAKNDAVEFLRALLADGPKPAKEIQAEAKDSGISKSTLDRAKQSLGIKPFRSGGKDGVWMWEIKDTQ